jgi:GNAT superfamily N-acetyltransferase
VRDTSINELRCTSARVAAGNSTSVDVQKIGWRSAATVMGAIRELCPVPLIRPVCFVTDAPALSAFLDARESARLPLYASAVSSADSAVLVFVPSVDASPVGMVVVHVRAREEMGWSDECGTLEYLQAPNGYLESLRVKDEHRRKGFGRLLLEAAEAWALAHQRSELWVHVSRSNERACRFYLACGWLERYIVCPSWNQGKPMVVFSKRAGAELSAAVAGGSVGSLSQSALAKRARDRVEDVEDEAGGENEADDG